MINNLNKELADFLEKYRYELRNVEGDLDRIILDLRKEPKLPFMLREQAD